MKCFWDLSSSMLKCWWKWTLLQWVLAAAASFYIPQKLRPGLVALPLLSGSLGVIITSCCSKHDFELVDHVLVADSVSCCAFPEFASESCGSHRRASFQMVSWDPCELWGALQDICLVISLHWSTNGTCFPPLQDSTLVGSCPPHSPHNSEQFLFLFLFRGSWGPTWVNH